MNKPLNIILLGDPAAGKATQARLLVKKYKLFNFDLGKAFRNIQKHKPESLEAKMLNNTINQGKLAPTLLARQILKDTIFNAPANKGILFNGQPRMLGEAKLVSKWLKATGRSKPLVLYISIPFSEIEHRVLNRTVTVNGKKVKRADDTVAALKERMRWYRNNVSEVVKFFKSTYTYRNINGTGSVEEVHARVLKALDSFVSKNHATK